MSATLWALSGKPIALIGSAQAEYTSGLPSLLIACGIPDNGV
jgi:hypothetical protein